MPTQEDPGLLGQDRSTPQGEHALVLGECGRHGLGLHVPEGVLALVDEDVGDRRPGALGDIDVGVPERQRQPLGDQPADRGLARSRRPDDDDDGRHQRITRVSR